MPPSTGEMDCTGFGIAILTLFYVSGHVNGLTVTMNGNAVSGQNVDLLITPASRPLTSIVVVTKPDSSEAGNCNAPLGGSLGLCTPSSDFNQDLATGLTTFSITTLSRATDEGVWKGSHGTEEGTIDIKVLTLPTGIDAPSSIVPPFTLYNGVNSVQDFVVTVPCAYPTASLTWVFIPVSGGSTASAQSSPAVSCTNDGNASCSDAQANNFTCTVIPQYNAAVAGQKVYLKASLTLAGEYQSTGINLTITETEITMAGPTTTTVAPTTTTTIPTTTAAPTTTTAAPTTTTAAPTTTIPPSTITTTPTTTVAPTTTTVAATTTTTMTPSRQTDRDVIIGASIGASLGFLVIVAIVAGVFIYFRSQKPRPDGRNGPKPGRPKDVEKPKRIDNSMRRIEKEKTMLYYNVNGQGHVTMDNRNYPDPWSHNPKKSRGYSNKAYTTPHYDGRYDNRMYSPHPHDPYRGHRSHDPCDRPRKEHRSAPRGHRPRPDPQYRDNTGIPYGNGMMYTCNPGMQFHNQTVW